VNDLEKLELELEEDKSPDTSISTDKQKAIYAYIRMQLLEQFHVAKTSAKISRKVGDHKSAEGQFVEAKRLLQMISALDEEAGKA
jgi:hypothetical protein